MKFVIWNKISTDNIDIIIVDEQIKILLNDILHKTIPIKESGDISIYNELLNDIEKINEVYIKDEEDNYHKLSSDFFKKLEAM